MVLTSQHKGCRGRAGDAGRVTTEGSWGGRRVGPGTVEDRPRRRGGQHRGKEAGSRRPGCSPRSPRAPLLCKADGRPPAAEQRGLAVGAESQRAEQGGGPRRGPEVGACS